MKTTHIHKATIKLMKLSMVIFLVLGCSLQNSPKHYYGKRKCSRKQKVLSKSPSFEKSEKQSWWYQRISPSNIYCFCFFSGSTIISLLSKVFALWGDDVTYTDISIESADLLISILGLSISVLNIEAELEKVLTKNLGTKTDFLCYTTAALAKFSLTGATYSIIMQSSFFKPGIQACQNAQSLDVIRSMVAFKGGSVIYSLLAAAYRDKKKAWTAFEKSFFQLNPPTYEKQ